VDILAKVENADRIRFPDRGADFTIREPMLFYPAPLIANTWKAVAY
jgi:hypothetical protein